MQKGEIIMYDMTGMIETIEILNTVAELGLCMRGITEKLDCTSKVIYGGDKLMLQKGSNVITIQRDSVVKVNDRVFDLSLNPRKTSEEISHYLWEIGWGRGGQNRDE